MNKSSLKLVYWFHGHSCPMSTLGYRAASLAKKLLKISRKDYYKVIAKVYFKSCAIDGIQIGFPATFANGNLLVQDEKSFRFEFIDTEKKTMIRINFNKPLIDFIDSYGTLKKTEKSERKIKDFFKKFVKYTQMAKLQELFIIEEQKI